jgi:Lipocalin-like domain
MSSTSSSTVIDQGGPVGSLRETLIGAWQLVACVETDVETGEIFLPMGPHPQGFILYTPDGYMSAQLSSPDRADFASGDMYRGTPEDYVAAGTSYLAYSGRYRVDDSTATRWCLPPIGPPCSPAASRPPASPGAGRIRTFPDHLPSF